MEKESNFRETWKMRIWMFLKMVNWICKKYCGFVAVTGCFFGTIELYVMTTDPILTTEVPVQISIAQKDYEMLLTGIFIIGATIYILFMIGYREICCRNKFSVEVSLLEIFYLLLIVVLFMKFSSVEGSVYDCWLCGAFPVRFFQAWNSTYRPKKS